MLDPNRLRLLRELAHRGTIAAVAEALAYTPSAVSQQLSALERESGASLLRRTGRGVTLTDAGRLLVGHADTILADIECAEAALAAVDADTSGVVRLGAFTSALVPIVGPALRALAESDPGVKLEVTELDPARAPDLLRSGHLDVALVHEYDNAPSIVGSGIDLVSLLDEPVFLVTRATTTVPSNDLRHYESRDWLSGSVGTLCHAMTVRSCEAAGFTPRIVHHVDDFGAVLDIVEASDCVALVPALGITAVAGDVACTELPIRRRTKIACRRGSTAAPTFTAVGDALRAVVPS
ncbi:LysR family transcriptional regulator [Gordonia amarae]|uniref:LysR family transcriptional regulator n=2 Tax=Gordonia amarae TaxID=36821 RepID=A0A857LMT9_9ACTN|nr:LysR family transcriptional regulator [Gordonia amarae]MCS3879212.1 DNA-binding transcriptional LysR family regulator [Gordonia amarae]QHN17719.1 LysR family transcriptional regulator [Gordonia amarae]QHN22249.1 LysR family transcriptional regulator [Gordonia amarae]QHN31126.1 LysR family transcriptional regulator [Gordonia amarae]QHN39871.1 LysR family transcriptional regulator [Gordonia amarae]